MKIFKNKAFSESTELEIFGVSWDEGEDQEVFLRKANFCPHGDSFSGVIKIFKRWECPDDFYAEIGDDGIFIPLYIPSIEDLIDLCNHIGISFAQIIQDRAKETRVIHQDDLDEYGSYLSIVPLNDEMVFVTSYEDISTRTERHQSRLRIKKMKEEEKAKKEKDAISVPT